MFLVSCAKTKFSTSIQAGYGKGSKSYGGIGELEEGTDGKIKYYSWIEALMVQAFDTLKTIRGWLWITSLIGDHAVMCFTNI